MAHLTDRQQQLYEWLKGQTASSIEEIGARFGISTATAYRDARALIDAGMVQKTRRGIRLRPAAEVDRVDDRCAFCGGTLNERSGFVIHLKDGTQRKACCAHCGLLALDQLEVVSALACDFLYGRMVNVQQAAFLLESEVSLCCQPSVLCFVTEDDARRFQAGFGGKVASLRLAVDHLKNLMAIQK